eukprot:3898149-Pleurochrysis_carterae.AAC.1
MNESLAISAKRARMVHVPTITICQTFNKSARPPEYDPLEWAKGVAILESNTNAVRDARACTNTCARTHAHECLREREPTPALARSRTSACAQGRTANRSSANRSSCARNQRTCEQHPA